jgi:hypothetical protein
MRHKYTRPFFGGLTAVTKTGGVFSNGFKVECNIMGPLKYTEQGHTVTVSYELFAKGEVLFTAYLSAIRRWDVPYSEEPLTTEHLNLIRENIVEAVEFMKIKFKVG